MSKKSIGTGITRLLFGLKAKDLKVVPFNEMTPRQFEELDRFLGKVGFLLASDSYKLTTKQADYIVNQIKQLDLYRERIMPGKKPDFKDFIPRDNLGIPAADKAREFKGFDPKVIQGGKDKVRPGKIDYNKMEEFLGVKLRGDETFDELLEIEKRMKNKDPEDFAGGGLATAIAKIKGKYGKKAIMKGKVKKKSEKQKRREMFEEFNKRNKEREEFIFGGGVGLKGYLKMLAEGRKTKQGKTLKGSDVLKYGNPKSQVPKFAKQFISDRDKAEMKRLRIAQLENVLEGLKSDRQFLASYEKMANLFPEVNKLSYDMLEDFLPPKHKARFRGLTTEMLDKEILQVENVLKNLKVGKDKRALNADGGLASMFRPRLKNGGPPNPGRRTFLKLMAGLASLPIVGKLFKPAATVSKVVPLKNTTTTMPDWFPSFVEKITTRNVGNKIDADVTLFKDKQLPDVEVYKYDDGRIEVQGKNGYDAEYDIAYTPPGVEVIDPVKGKAIKTPGDFEASDTVYRMTDPDGGFDVDGEIVDSVDEILGGSSTKLEGYAKGTNKEKYTIGQRRIDEAEAIGDRADDITPYRDVDPTDFVDPEDVQDFAKGGLATMFKKK